MELELSGKTAVVTGASRGIGLAIVQALLDEGVTVIGGARKVPDGKTRLAGGENFAFVPADLSSDAGAEEFAEAVDVPVDLLVNNVGSAPASGIRVNSVSPGPTATDLWLGKGGVAETNARATGKSASQIRAGAEAAIPTGRFTQPGEVARLVLVLASSTFGNITGADFVIDGGMRPTV